MYINIYKYIYKKVAVRWLLIEIMNIFEKLKQSLAATRKRFSSNLQLDEAQHEEFDEAFFNELEETLVLADVGMHSTTEILNRLRAQTKQKKLKFKHELKQELIETLTNILSIEVSNDFATPRVVLMLGVNGVGKTTTIAKLANFLKQQNKTVVLAAGDTYRAAAVEQLKVWANRVDFTVISHGQDCDPASVVFDTIAYAKKRGVDFVLCDTAGRLHNNKNLMQQLQKIARVAKSEANGEIESLLVVDSTMGQNCLSQVEEFKKIVNLNGIVLTKLDGTAKGGIAIAIACEKQVPVRFLGLGEKVSDLQEFEASSFAKALLN